MLNIPSTIKALYQTDGIRKNFRVHFPNGEYSDLTNSNVVVESVKFTESLCSQSTFKFGLAEASVLEFETVGVGNMYGMTIEASIEIDTSSLSGAQIADIVSDAGDGTIVLAAVSDIGYGFYRIPLGTFKVDSCPRDHQSMAHRQVTAYTDVLQNRKLSLPSVPYKDTIEANLNAVIGATLEIGLTMSDSYPSSDYDFFNHAALYLSGGTSYRLTLKNEGGSGLTEHMLAATYLGAVGGVTDPVPFFSVDMPSYNAAAYDAFGVAVANALTAANYILIYDASGHQIYQNNEEALRNVCPWLFAPCVCYTFYKNDSNHEYYQTHVNVANGKLTPIINKKSEDSTYNVGFYVDDTDVPMGGYSRYFYCVAPYIESTVATVGIYLNGVKAAEISNEGYLTELPVVKRYKLQNRSPYSLMLKQTSEDKYRYGLDYGSSATPKQVEQTTWGFYGIEVEAISNGALEVNAMFAKTDRFGGFETVRLDNTSPMSIITDNYSECWWDEYDVDPIGMVNVTYQDTDENGNPKENTTIITIGSGQSVYDMSNNAALKNLGSASLSAVTALVKANFAPYLSTVTFTPIELTMQGWPWLEAGDALEITAEDGTVVESYALRVEMSGIQNLSSVITAEGGEIIEEVE